MKDLDYYMSLPYEVKVQELSEDDGGGIMLSIPLLGEAAVRGYGDTYPEARAKLEAVKKDFLEIWLNDGWDIPEPQIESWAEVFMPVRELGLVGA
ncbi:MAG: hypothetical protein IJT02_08045 [Synergistaceae bacterium]|nr:hypothetical protein [Synergistaceae bacterium]